MVVTHDRAFLDAVATRIVELDRGVLRSYPGAFAAYEARKVEELSAEALASARADKLLAQEEVWVRKGVEARRTQKRRPGPAPAGAARAAGGAARVARPRPPRGRRRPAERQDRRRAEERLDALSDAGRRAAADRQGLLGDDPARRQGRPDRPERRRQDDAAQAHPRRAAADLGLGAPGRAPRGRVLRPDAQRARPRRDARRQRQPRQRVGRDGGRQEARDELPVGLPVLAGARQLAGAHALGRRAQPRPAGAPARAARERARPRRADQRPRHRHPRAARRAAARLRRHAVPGQPRPAFPRQRGHQHDRLGRRRRARPVARVRRRLRGLEAAEDVAPPACAMPPHGSATPASKGAGATARARRSDDSAGAPLRRRRRPPPSRASSATRSSASSMRCRRGSRRSRSSRRSSARCSPAPSSTPRTRFAPRRRRCAMPRSTTSCSPRSSDGRRSARPEARSTGPSRGAAPPLHWPRRRRRSPSASIGTTMASTPASSPWQLATRTARMNPSAIREILKLTELPGIISLAGGLPSALTFPVEAVREATARVLRDTPREALQYAGERGLRAAARVGRGRDGAPGPRRRARRRCSSRPARSKASTSSARS